MSQSATARLVKFLINVILFGGIMFIFYYYVEKMPTNEAMSKAALAGVIFGSLNIIIRSLLNRKNKS